MMADPRIALIESLSRNERAWQPTAEDFLGLHENDARPPAPAANTRYRDVALAVRRVNGRYVWVLLESFDDVCNYEEIARAQRGDARYVDALEHGTLVLRTLVDDESHGPVDAD